MKGKRPGIPENENEHDDPYAVLGLSRNATEAEIKRAYLELVRRYPPERHPEEFKKIRAAYDRLKDRAERARLDLFHFNLDESALLGKTEEAKLDLGLSLAGSLSDVIRWTSDLARRGFPDDLKTPDLGGVIEKIER